MLLKRTHTFLEILLGIFLLYLLLVRGVISWAQFAPESFSSVISKYLHSELHYEKLEIDQNWLGFELEAQNLKLVSKNFDFEVKALDVDINLFSILIPKQPFGDFIKLQDGVYVQKTFDFSVAKERPALDLSFYQRQLERSLFIPEQLQSFWSQTSIKDIRFLFKDKPLAFHLHRLELVKTKQITLVSEFGVRFGDLIDYDTFSLTLKARPNSFGGIDQGSARLVSFSALDTQPWAELLPKKWLQILPHGKMFVEAEAEFEDSRLRSVVTDTSSQYLSWPQNDSKLPESLGAKLKWTLGDQWQAQASDDWVIELLDLQLDNKYVRDLSNLKVRIADDLLFFDADAFNLEPFRVVMQAVVKDSRLAQTFGKITDLSLKELSGTLNWQTLALPVLSFNLQQLAVPKTDFPGVEIEDLSFDKHGDLIQLQTKKPIWVTDKQIHHKPIRVILPKVTMRLPELNQWQIEPFKFSIDKNYFNLKKLRYAEQKIQAQLRVQTSKVAEILDYMPYEVMSQDLAHWLKQSDIRGERFIAQLSIDSNLPELLASGKGLKATGRVEKGALRFNSQWPKIEDFDVDFSYQDFRLELNSKAFALFPQSDVKAVKIVLENLHQRDIAVQVSGEVDAPFANSIAYLRKTPVIKSDALQRFLAEKLAVTGDLNVILKEVWVPISGLDGKAERYSILAELKNASAQIYSMPNITALNGKIDISDEKVTSNLLRGEMLEGPINVLVQGTTGLLNFSANGQAYEAERLAFSKAIKWNSQIVVPFHEGEAIEISGQAALNQAGSRVPSPFSATDMNEPLHFSANATKESFNLKLAMKDVLSAELVFEEQLDKQPDTWASGYVILGSEAESQEGGSKQEWLKDGKLHWSGVVPQINFDDWKMFVSQLEKTYPIKGGKPVDYEWGDSHILVEKLRFDGYAFPKTEVSWHKRDAKDWLYRFVGPQLDLAIVEKSDKSLDIQVGHLTLEPKKVVANATSKEEAVKLDIPKVEATCDDARFNLISPRISFKAKQINFHGYPLKNLNFQLQKHRRGYVATTMSGELGDKAAKISGAYSFDKEIDLSSLVLFLSSENPGELRNFFKMNRGISGKSAQAKLQVTWPGDFSCFGVDGLEGPVEFNVKDGVIDDLDPGVARLLGLLSVDSIARRLKLNLQDLTSEGLIFDEIKGVGYLEKEKLRLEMLNVEAPSTKVHIEGDIYVKDEVFDLKAEVTPALGSSLPTIAALAGAANPLAAIALYTFAKAVPDINEDLMTFEYKIDGPWKEPKIKFIPVDNPVLE